MSTRTKASITIQDLKIGNYVKCKVSNDNADYVVSALDGFGLKVMLNGARQGTWYEEDKIKPIKLTEEWLLKLGFSDKEYKLGYIGIDIKYEFTITDFVLTKPTVLGEWQKNYAWEHVKHRFTELKYVHQLQNIYYSLTGQELIIK